MENPLFFHEIYNILEFIEISLEMASFRIIDLESNYFIIESTEIYPSIFILKTLSNSNAFVIDIGLNAK